MDASERHASKLDSIIQELKDKYEKAVRNNPQTVAQVESAIRILSFLVAGRFENGDLISELVYSASNLLVFLNDNIFKKASKYIADANKFATHLRRWLTVLDHVEVFLEMGARKRWGTKGAWIVITIIHIVKTALRFYLLIKMEAGMVSTPAIPAVDREILKTSEEHDRLEDVFDEEIENSAQQKTFKLKSSGREIRTLDAAGHNNIRSWGVPQNGKVSPEANLLARKQRLLTQLPTPLSGKRIWAEGLHCARPLAHLLSMYAFGMDSWKPWLVALGLDMTSQKLYGDLKDLNPREQQEVKRRNMMLLYYLMRSPFYCNYTKSRLTAVLTVISQYVPLSGFVIRPLLGYLPTWQAMYFYVWAT
ncbi:peroxisomal membrane protein PEX16-like [Dreissena polymorpha]|uniref:Peroxisomal membrane protein PEX16 n=1 Tax=Dreissena polymorpha TaxID=45954 RepID=A0A9D4MSQ5_DREPO|nr:peroxisomal membrane protein PEX16-like [Dreissena polymorpha]KAH3883177.1 hypothetical protein DPMN_007130 [Dreissena polymorpha]